MTFFELLQMREQVEKDIIGWHKANKHFQNIREEDAMVAGFRAGFMEALKFAKLHNEGGNYEIR